MAPRWQVAFNRRGERLSLTGYGSSLPCCPIIILFVVYYSCVGMLIRTGTGPHTPVFNLGMSGPKGTTSYCSFITHATGLYWQMGILCDLVLNLYTRMYKMQASPSFDSIQCQSIAASCTCQRRHARANKVSENFAS